MDHRQPVVLASANAGKLKEMQTLLETVSWACRPITDWSYTAPEETGLTFVENALIKARAACALTGLASIADDSGLCVPALQGAPGLYSARYAGEDASDEDHYLKLLDAMQGLSDRRAFYHASLVFLRHADDPAPLICQGVWHGEVTTTPQGEGGFGYDPVFFVPALGLTAAQIDHKNQISHRARALRALIALLKCA